MEFSDVPVFNGLCEQTIANQYQYQPWEIHKWNGLQLQCCGKWRERKYNAYEHDGGSQCHYRSGRPALYEWNFPGPDHMNDQCLRQQSFNEPAALKQ